jgi:Uma2 family endonuclease
MIAAMDTVLVTPLTTETFLAWEDRQEGRYEFDGRNVIAMTGGSFAHQDIVYNLRGLLGRILSGQPFRVGQEMRLRIGAQIRYPDVMVCAGPIDQTIRTVTDAVAIFEVLSDDTAATDRVEKLIEYSNVPSLRSYVLLEQTTIGATLLRRDLGGEWTATAHTTGELALPGLNISIPMPDIYQGLTFEA